jgi:hypothetical protein
MLPPFRRTYILTPTAWPNVCLLVLVFRMALLHVQPVRSRLNCQIEVPVGSLLPLPITARSTNIFRSAEGFYLGLENSHFNLFQCPVPSSGRLCPPVPRQDISLLFGLPFCFRPALPWVNLSLIGDKLICPTVTWILDPVQSSHQQTARLDNEHALALPVAPCACSTSLPLPTGVQCNYTSLTSTSAGPTSCLHGYDLA